MSPIRGVTITIREDEKSMSYSIDRGGNWPGRKEDTFEELLDEARLMIQQMMDEKGVE